MAYVTYTEEELTHLERLASRGDDTAFDMIFQEAKRLAKSANSRLLRLERADLEEASQAYQKAVTYTDMEFNGSYRFRVNKSLSLDALVKEFREMRSFMSKESSTVKGMRHSQKRLVKTLSTYGIDIPESQRMDFYKFVQSDTVQDVIDYIGEYDIVMDIIANNIDKITDSFLNLQRQFEQFLAGDEYFDEFIERVFNLGEGDKKSDKYRTYEQIYKRHTDRRITRDKPRKKYK